MNQRKQQLNHMLHTAQRWWDTYFLLRWVIANMLGWVLGLLSLSLMLWLFGWIGALSIGAWLGIGLGLPQAWILFPDEERANRRQWVLYSALGGFFAVFPAAILSVIGIFNTWIAAILIGVCFGGIFSGCQTIALHQSLGDDAFRWIPIGILSAVSAALMIVLTLVTPIPILASPATIIYALITGWQLQQWRT
ncbi:MAG: hypothetical protein WBC91_00215 [Phototrophicaceae bacterium]